MDTRSRRTFASRLLVTFAAALALAGASATGAEGERPAPAFVKLRITHRVYLEFQDTLTVAMNERQIIGDTEFSCEVVEFYPHFAIMDSTKAVVSLSDDPKNPAFKIRVFQDEEKSEDTWAFYGIEVPHFGRTSYLAFQVLSFEYRGTVLGGDDAATSPASGDKERQK